jgi:hypothetical protein
MASNAGAPVLAEGLEEGMPASAEGAIGQRDAQHAGRVVVLAVSGELFVLVQFPPAMASIVRTLRRSKQHDKNNQ